jgi:putative tryptophan/tyrosine transport system substrate-binding protein
MRGYATELIALAPDVAITGGSEAIAAFQQATCMVPIVFVNVGDPVGARHIDSLSRPSGNATGFIVLDYGLSPKWLELLKDIAPSEIAPSVTLVAIIRDVALAGGTWRSVRSGSATRLRSNAASLHSRTLLLEA